jgi:transposase
MKNENDFVGVDLHTNRLTAFYIRGSERWSEDFELSELPKFLETLRSETYVAVEASCNTFMFHDIVRRVTPNVSVVNPYKMKLISMVNKKTDKVDAEKLAMFLKSQVLGGEEMIEPVYVPEQEIRDLRSLFATHKNILGQIVMTKNRIHALLKQHMLLVKASDITSKAGRARIKEKCGANANLAWHINFLLQTLEFHEKQRNDLAQSIYEVAQPFRAQIKILTSFPGISAFTACALIADIGDIKRFPNAKKLASYLRSAPGVDSSNETTKIKKTNKFGRRLSIELLIQGVTHFKTAHPGLAAWHGMMMDRKKSKGKVRIAICRKVICQIFQMLRKGEYHHHRNEVLHLEKMRLYDRAVAKLATA